MTTIVRRSPLAVAGADDDPGVVVVEIDGVLDEDSLDELEGAIRVANAPVVVDLDLATVAAPDLLAKLLVRLPPAAEVCLACSRMSAQLLLDRAGVANITTVFGSTRDAVQAHVLAAEGYGSGWRPGTPLT